MDEITKEEAGLEARLAELRLSVASAGSIENSMGSAQALLRMLRKRLDQPVSWELKRKLVEVLVAGIRVDTFDEDGVKQGKITVVVSVQRAGAGTAACASTQLQCRPRDQDLGGSANPR